MYQIQLQMEVCVHAVPHCDFVVWTKQSTIVESHDFFYFIYGFLPEIKGKWYTRTPVADSQHIVPIPSTSNTPAMRMKMMMTVGYGAIAVNLALVTW